MLVQVLNVIGNQDWCIFVQVLNVTGNQDLCYYNFKCARRLGVLSSFNTVYSNIGYVMLGALFLILVYRRYVMRGVVIVALTCCLSTSCVES